jgi:hypothetical protein
MVGLGSVSGMFDRIDVFDHLANDVNEASVGVCSCHQGYLITGHRKNASGGDEFIIDLQRIFLIDVLNADHLWQSQESADVDVHFPNHPEDTLPQLTFNGIEISDDRTVESQP